MATTSQSCPPGKAQCFLIIEGEGELRFGDKRYPIHKHDVIACPTGGPEVAHQIINAGKTTMRYLALSTLVDVETCEYTDSRKMLIVAGQRGRVGLRKMFRAQDTVDSYDREPSERGSTNQILREAEMTVEIGPFRPEHARSFAQLNRQWLEEYDLMEPSNGEQLADPEAYFLGRGGQIFVALRDADVIGTCAVVPRGGEGWELAKLTVSSEFRGQGIARRLVKRCIAYAQERDAQRIFLVSNSQLQAALRLYESFGFKYCPMPEVKEYEHEDVCMELCLGVGEPTPCGSRRSNADR